MCKCKKLALLLSFLYHSPAHYLFPSFNNNINGGRAHHLPPGNHTNLFLMDFFHFLRRERLCALIYLVYLKGIQPC
jgi:hypothetical protein